MIKFFRKIRQNLLSEGKTGKYLKYAIGEIILVVIGILFALQINNWNIKNVQQKEGRKYLTSIKSNLVQDTLAMRLTVQNIKLTLKTLDSTAGLISVNESILLKGPDITSAMLTTHNFVPENTSIEDLTSSGKFNLIDNQKIAEQTLLYYNKIEHNVGAFNKSIEIYTRDIIAPYFMNRYQMDFDYPNSLKFNKKSNPDNNENKSDNLFIINAIKYRHFILSSLSYLYEETITSAKNLIVLINIELKE
jgi:hypothetical protein